MSKDATAEASSQTASTAGERPASVEETTEVAPAATEETTTAAPAPGTTDTTEEESGQVAGADAVGVEGYEKMKADALARAAAAKDPTPPAKAAETEAKPETTAAVTEEAAAAETTAEVAGGTPATTAEEEPDKKPERIRISGLKDGHLVAAANTIAREENIPFAEAWERVAPKKAEAAASSTAAGGTPATAAPAATTEKLRTREEIQADITEQKTVKRKAATEMDNVAIIDADEAIETLREELDKVAAAEQRAEQDRERAQRTQFETTVATSKTKAVDYWPEAGDEKSELSKLTLELADKFEKDPALANLVSEADSPFYFTQLAAKELGLLPKHLRKAAPAPAAAPAKPATPTATKPAPKNQSAVVRPTQPAAQPASGGARTTQEESQGTLGVDKIRSPHDYDALKKRLKIPSLAQAR